MTPPKKSYSDPTQEPTQPEMRTLASYGWPYKSVDMQEVILDWKNSIKPVGAKNPATQPQRDRQKRTEDEIKRGISQTEAP